ncbi:MAG: type III secretion inner membrane ring lipoprotein SctJ [Deltaproteobacteria bacterium]|jgi:type III secretion protein J|nr:type III secretion inner membrane ring lipoprotein SctJ [Deltaproteobacteria bacterium]
MKTTAAAILRLLWLIPFLTIFAVGCQTELYSGLSENEANLMLSLLLSRDIETEKVSRGKDGFAITVDKSDVVASLEILSDNGLPRTRHENLGQVFSGQGMISTPLEEQSRLSFALSEELSDTFSKIDGVLTARVHVVLATKDQTGAVLTPASAAVVLRHLPDSPVTNLTAKIREVSSKSVPGLSDDRVSVMLVPVRSEVVIPTPREKTGFSTWTVLAGAAALVLGGVFLLSRLGFKLSRQSGERPPLS